MRNIFVVLSLICCLNPCLTWAADNKPLENTEFQVFKAQTELKLDTLKENQAKSITEATKSYVEDLNKQSAIIAAQDKRIGDLNLYLAIYAVIGGVLGILVAVAAYLSAGSKAREEARKEAKEFAETWFNKNEKDLLARLKVLEDGVTTHANNAKQSMSDHADTVKEEKEKIHKNMLSPYQVKIQEDSSQLKIASEKITHKPSSLFTFDDWDTLAFNAMSDKKPELAAEYWDKAARIDNTDDHDIARALFHKGVAYTDHKEYEKAISSFEDVIGRFSASNFPAIQQLVTRSLLNKGSSFGKLLLLEKAIIDFQDILSRVGTSTLPYLQEHVTDALNGLGFGRLLQAKQIWANTTQRQSLLNEALILFKKAEVSPQSNMQSKAIMLGNLAYALWLIGHTEQATNKLKEALQLGGEDIRDAELADTTLHTVDKDTSFVELVNKLWDEQIIKAKVDK